MKNILLIFLLSFISFIVKADEANTLWQLANHAYKSKNYEAATLLYDSIFKKKINNAELYYNAGNAYFKSHKMGMAVWCYEKAYQLSPNDEDIETNLKIARLRLIDKVDVIPDFILIKWWKQFLNLLPIKIWAICAIAFFWLMLSGWFLYYFTFNYNLLGKRLIWVGMFAGMSFCLFAWASNKQFTNEKYAVIVSTNTAVKSAPDESSSDLFLIHEGLKIKVNKVNKVNADWANISIADGKVGWCKTNEFKNL